MIKMIFSDFDNTMLDYYSEKNYFADYQLNILSRVREKDIKFCIVTGRCVSFFYQFPDLLERIDYIIASNGACVYDVKKKKFIYYKYIEEDSLNKIINYAKKNHGKFLLNSLNHRYQYGNWNNVICDNYQEDVDYFCEQLVLSIDERNLNSCCRYLTDLQNVVVNNVAFWNTDCSLDINDISISKGSGIVWLCQFLNLNLKDTIGFGDGENDLSMFEVVGKSVAVGNASDKIQQISDDVSLKCNDNGIFRYLEDKILNR